MNSYTSLRRQKCNFHSNSIFFDSPHCFLTLHLNVTTPGKLSLSVITVLLKVIPTPT